eukprot:gnl/Dysnectes_brevis/3784_a4865_715.p1 GENE.gnl/Dysnectes_brevis/3784_a4865_715~~gnl/Dysnectes_brevis/3784_a4865_715.p1  ORF type:complete len:994 (-),score=121.06 gnl/Dysnectes_brevis/3784_a4865_715:33-3014(-)
MYSMSDSQPPFEERLDLIPNRVGQSAIFSDMPDISEDSFLADLRRDLPSEFSDPNSDNPDSLLADALDGLEDAIQMDIDLIRHRKALIKEEDSEIGKLHAMFSKDVLQHSLTLKQEIAPDQRNPPTLAHSAIRSLSQSRGKELHQRELVAQRTINVSRSKANVTEAKAAQKFRKQSQLQQVSLVKHHRQAETRLASVLRSKGGVLGSQRLFEHAVDQGGDPAFRRRWVIEWQGTPQPLKISFDWLRGIRQLPPGRYAIRAVLLSCLGGSELHYKRTDSRFSGVTGPFPWEDNPGEGDDGHRFARDLRSSVSILVPPFSKVDPSTCVEVQLWALRTERVPYDAVVAWGAFPCVDAALHPVRGPKRIPLLWGPRDPQIVRWEQIERQIGEDLDCWMGNMYLRFLPTSKYLTEHKEKPVYMGAPPIVVPDHPPRAISHLPQPKELRAALDEQRRALRHRIPYRLPEDPKNDVDSPNPCDQDPPLRVDHAEDDEDAAAVDLQSSSDRWDQKVQWEGEDIPHAEDAEDIRLDQDEEARRIDAVNANSSSAVHTIYSRIRGWFVRQQPLSLAAYVGDTLTAGELGRKVPARLDRSCSSADHVEIPLDHAVTPPSPTRSSGAGDSYPHEESPHHIQPDQSRSCPELSAYSSHLSAPASVRLRLGSSILKTRFIARALPGHLGLRRWSPSSPLSSLLWFCLWLLLRPVLHGSGEYLMMSMIGLPIRGMSFSVLPIPSFSLQYQLSAVGSLNAALILATGTLFLTSVTVALNGLCWAMERISAAGLHPQVHSALLALSLMCPIDPIVQLGADLLNQPDIPDYARLTNAFKQGGDPIALAVVVTVLIYTLHILTGILALHRYILTVHAGGRLADTFSRIHDINETFFVPGDLEVSADAVDVACRAAVEYRGDDGASRIVQGGSQHLSVLGSDERVHLSHIGIFDQDLDGSTFLLRHFVIIDPSHCIVALTTSIDSVQEMITHLGISLISQHEAAADRIFNYFT